MSSVSAEEPSPLSEEDLAKITGRVQPVPLAYWVTRRTRVTAAWSSHDAASATTANGRRLICVGRFRFAFGPAWASRFKYASQRQSAFSTAVPTLHGGGSGCGGNNAQTNGAPTTMAMAAAPAATNRLRRLRKPAAATASARWRTAASRACP